MKSTAEPLSIPFLDLAQIHDELRGELLDVMIKALDTSGFIGGPALTSFEEHFAAHCDAAHCVGVGSGTDALRFALLAGGVKAGDTVLTVAHTFIATAEAISQAGAYPEFIDIDERTYNLSPALLRSYLESCKLDSSTGKRLSSRTGRPITAVVPVHLYGQMAEMDAILEIAAEFNLMVFEDACQAHGAEYFSQSAKRWRRAGSMGKAAAFSFYPGKNLGACGEAGAVTTSDPECAKQVRMLRDHGQSTKYYHEVVGYNGRLDAIQAGFLDVKLNHLPKWTEQRRAAAKRYNALLESVKGVIAPYESSSSSAVYHLYVVRVAKRREVQQRLTARGIGTGIHYPVPLHLQTAYQHLSYHKGSLPVTEMVAEQVLSLPMYPGLSAQEQCHVVEAIEEATQDSPMFTTGP